MADTIFQKTPGRSVLALLGGPGRGPGVDVPWKADEGAHGVSIGRKTKGPFPAIPPDARSTPPLARRRPSSRGERKAFHDTLLSGEGFAPY